MAHVPLIAVVVSTHNRAPLLRRLVEALAAQQDIADYEAIIVDDCSSDDTWAVLQKLSATATFPLRVLRTERNSGPATGRNLGWRSSTAPLVAFTDDDCVPDPNWLATMVAALERADVVQGLTDAAPIAGAGRGPFSRLQVVESFSWLFETCNIGYRREVLERLNGFDATFSRPFGEDVDLGWRAVKAGATTSWEPEARVLHDVVTTGDTLQNKLLDWVEWMKDSRRRVFAPMMVKKHPELREYMYRRFFLKSYHPPALAALIGTLVAASGLVLGPRWFVGFVLVLPWIWFRTVFRPPAARRRWLWAVLPLTFVADVTEVLVMARGSVRFRTLLL